MKKSRSKTDAHRRPRKITAPRATRAGRALWAGFREDAIAELEYIKYARDCSEAEHSRAAFELAIWRRHEGALEEALDLARLSRVARTGTPWSGTQRLLEADLLREVGFLEESRDLLDEALAKTPDDPHLLLRRANSFAAPHAPVDTRSDLIRLAIVNQVFANAGFSSVGLANPEKGLRFDNLTVSIDAAKPATDTEALVSVIFPAFNAQDWLASSVESILSQTWRNIEVVIVDDASTDGTVEVALHLAARDDRIRLVRQPSNRGAYAARNRGVLAAEGDFITVNDSDDWSHPERIAHEVQALQDDPSLVGVMPHRSRVTDSLIFLDPSVRFQDMRIIPDISSLMVPRSIVEEVGLWDEVRATGDYEFGRRLEALYGREAVARIHPGAPLSLSLRLPLSISTAGPTSILSLHHVIGARMLYFQAVERWHASPSFRDSLPHRPGASRPFPAPRSFTDPNSPDRDRRRTDVALMSDLALQDPTTTSNIEELSAQSRAGLTTALIHNPIYEWRFRDPIDGRVWDAIDGGTASLVSKGEHVDTDLLIVRHPKIAETFVDELPTVTAGRVLVIVNQLPYRSYEPESRAVYDLAKVVGNIRTRFGDEVIWCPGDPLIRRFLQEHHADILDDIRLDDDDWVDIIDIEAWQRPLRVIDGATIRIGRHGQDSDEEWPVPPENLRSAYPQHPDIEVHVLGGAEVPAGALGGSLPRNWTVHPLDSVRDFLHGLDVYVHFGSGTHVETFGRTMLEALAVGMPIVTNAGLAPVLGSAAIYAEPGDVLDIVLTLRDDPLRYKEQVRAGWRLLEQRFSYDAHLERLHRLRSGIASP